MKQTKYTCTFKSNSGHTHTINVTCNGFIEALILSTADAIRSGMHYQLDTIEDERGMVVQIDNIGKLSAIIY